jgi:hypothetical protein
LAAPYAYEKGNVQEQLKNDIALDETDNSYLTDKLHDLTSAIKEKAQEATLATAVAASIIGGDVSMPSTPDALDHNITRPQVITTELSNADDYVEFRSSLRTPRSFHPNMYSERTKELNAQVEQAEKEYSDAFSTLRKVAKAAGTVRPPIKKGEDNSLGFTDPVKVTEYTGVTPDDPNWNDAVQTYRKDLRTKTMPKYQQAAKDAYEKLYQLDKAVRESVAQDAAEHNVPYTCKLTRDEFEQWKKSPNWATK